MATSTDTADDSTHRPPPNTVLLNVYDIVWGNALLCPFGVGVHHTAIEVYGTEFAFGRSSRGTGVFELRPRSCPPHIFRESIVLGSTALSLREVQQRVATMALEWMGPTYHLTKRNCNSFANALAAQLLSVPPPPGMAVEDVYGGCPPAAAAAQAAAAAGGPASVLPGWANRVARAAEMLLPRRMVTYLDDYERKMQGM
jgi:hypothetical protein